MKFLKKVFISLSVIVLLFCSIFLSPKHDDYFKGTEVHASAVGAIPFFALNPELIPVFLLGVLLLACCGVVANNIDKIVAAGNQLKETIEAAGQSISDFVTSSRNVIVNEVLKQHIITTINKMSKTRYSSAKYNYNTYKLSDVTAKSLGEVAFDFNDIEPDDSRRKYYLEAELGTGLYYNLIHFKINGYVRNSEGAVSEYHNYLVELGDKTGDVYSTNSLKTELDAIHNTTYHIKPVTSISISFNHVIPKSTDASYQFIVTFLDLVNYGREYNYNEIDEDDEYFPFNVFDTSPLTLQNLAAHGIIYEPKLNERGDITSFNLTITKDFAKWRPKYRYLTGVGINSEDFVGKGIKFNALEANGPITVNDYSGSEVKERAISYPNAKLLENAYDTATVAKAMDIAFPNTLDNLVPLDNVLTKDREFANLKELDNVLDYSARFLDEARTKGLDNVLTDAKTLDLSGIDEAVSDKALADTFDARAYALDNVRVATAGIGAVPAVNDDTANVGAVPKEKEEADWLSKVPWIGKLWDFLKEIIKLLNAILKAILEAIIAAMKATIAPVLEFLKAIVHTLQEIAKGRALSDVLVNDVVIGDTAVLSEKFGHLQSVLNNKFPNVTPLNLSFTDKPAFDDFTANIPHVGTVTIISADMMNKFAPVAKAFFSGFFYFLTGLFFFRKFHKVSED